MINITTASKYSERRPLKFDRISKFYLNFNFEIVYLVVTKKVWRCHIFVASSEYKNITVQLMQILDLLGMYFDVAVVFFMN